jgi:predicted PurR-regulated permease PerM
LQSTRATVSRDTRLLVPLWLLVVVALLFLLRSMRVLLVPMALAGLASIVLYPLVRRLQRLRIPPAAGAALVVLVILGSMLALGWSLQDEFTQTARDLPQEIRQIRRQMEASSDGGTIRRLREALEEVRKTAESAAQPPGAPAATGGGAPDQAPASGGPGDPTTQYLWFGSAGAVELAGHLTVITFLTYFLLVGAHAWRGRVIALLDRSERRTGDEIIDEITHQVQRFLIVRVATAVLVGVATWLALSWLGAPAAGLWSVAAAVLNSVPFFGPLIVSVGLAAVGLLAGGFSAALQYAGVALAITSLEGWLVTPPLLGQALRMNTLSVFVSLLVWSWVWGIWGTLLAVPLMAVVKAISDRVEAFRPMSRLLAP